MSHTYINSIDPQHCKKRSNTAEVHGQLVPALLYSMYVWFVTMGVGCGLSQKHLKCTRYAKYTELLVRNTTKIYTQHCRTLSNIKHSIYKVTGTCT